MQLFIADIQPLMMVGLKNGRSTLVVQTNDFGMCLYDVDGEQHFEPLDQYDFFLYNNSNEGWDIEVVYGYADDTDGAISKIKYDDRKVLWRRDEQCTIARPVNINEALRLINRLNALGDKIMIATRNNMYMDYEEIRKIILMAEYCTARTLRKVISYEQ